MTSIFKSKRSYITYAERKRMESWPYSNVWDWSSPFGWWRDFLKLNLLFLRLGGLTLLRVTQLKFKVKARENGFRCSRSKSFRDRKMMGGDYSQWSHRAQTNMKCVDEEKRERRKYDWNGIEEEEEGGRNKMLDKNKTTTKNCLCILWIHKQDWGGWLEDAHSFGVWDSSRKW